MMNIEPRRSISYDDLIRELASAGSSNEMSEELGHELVAITLGDKPMIEEHPGSVAEASAVVATNPGPGTNTMNKVGFADEISNKNKLEQEQHPGQSDFDMLERKLLRFEDPNDAFETTFFKVVPKSDRETGSWLQVEQSIYGGAIYLIIDSEEDSLAEKVLTYVLFIFPPLFGVAASQSFVLYKLWESLPSLWNTEYSPFCLNIYDNEDSLLFLCCTVGVFLISMIPQLIGILNEWTIIRTATIFFVYQDDEKARFKPALGKTHVFRWFFGGMIVVFQFCLWLSVVIVGILYILTTEGISNIVQAAVAITFINEIDNMAVFLYGIMVERMPELRFRCKVHMHPMVSALVCSACSMPIIVACVTGSVFGLHNTYCP